MKTKIILKSNTIVFDPFNLFVFVNICLLVLFKKFNMDITEKMVSFQIIQNVINVKTTLVYFARRKNGQLRLVGVVAHHNSPAFHTQRPSAKIYVWQSIFSILFTVNKVQQNFKLNSISKIELMKYIDFQLIHRFRSMIFRPKLFF